MRNPSSSPVTEGTKAKWVKPALTQLKAGAAEFNNGNVDDGDNGNGANNS